MFYHTMSTISMSTILRIFSSQLGDNISERLFLGCFSGMYFLSVIRAGCILCLRSERHTRATKASAFADASEVIFIKSAFGLLPQEALSLVLYTIVPPELIWATDSNETITLQEVEHQGVTLIVQSLGMNTGRIVQIKSTDPYAFLKQEYQPGRTISFTPDLSNKEDELAHISPGSA
jgi:hypothetical protein